MSDPLKHPLLCSSHQVYQMSHLATFALWVHQTSASTKHIFCLLPFLSLFTYHDYDGNNVDDASLSISGGAPPPTLATIGARRVRCQPEGA